MSAAHTGSTTSCNCVNLVNKYNTWCIFLGILKKVSYSGCTYTYKHFHEVRTGNAEKWHSRLSCNCLCQKGFTGSRRSYKENSLWYSRTKLGVFSRCLEEIHYLLKLFLFLFQACHIIKRSLVVFLCGKLCPVFAKIHHLASTTLGSRIVIGYHKQDKDCSKHQQIWK